MMRWWLEKVFSILFFGKVQKARGVILAFLVSAEVHASTLNLRLEMDASTF